MRCLFNLFDLRTMAGLTFVVAISLANYALADNLGYDFELGALLLAPATYVLGRHV